MHKYIVAFALVAVCSVTGSAQGKGSDFLNPGGAGAGTSGITGAGVVPVPGVQPGNITGPIGEVINGNVTGTANFRTGLIQGGVPEPQATALANGLRTLGIAPTRANFVVAVLAYNAAVNALPPGAPLPPQLVEARAALVDMGAKPRGAPGA